MKENSYLQIKNYFENLVQQSKFLNDFVGFFSREWAEKKNTVKGLQEPVLSLWKYELGFDGPENNTIAVRKIGFAIMYNEVKPDEWVKLLKVLINAKVMVYSVQDSADATLIFELQNDRGKRLTDLEALKSYLMHLIYLHAKNPNDSLAIVQTHFSNIYRYIER